MTTAKANGLTIEYEEFGNAGDPAVLLIGGFGCQLTIWPVAMCEALADNGYRVIRHDNRDIGLTTKIEDAGPVNVGQLMADAMSGKPVSAPYSLDDMADDAVGLMDAIGIDKAHVVGMSMGGMIAQLIAINHPSRVLSLTSIMSSTGNPELPQGKPEAMAALTAPAPDPDDREAVIEMGVNTWNIIGSPGFPTPDRELREMIGSNYDRNYYPEGLTRQIAAIMSAGSRVEKLKGVTAPTLVIHGAEDPLVPVEAGQDTAAAVPGSTLEVITGMGHDLAPGLVPVLVGKIVPHLDASGTRQAAE